jgi:hypothetical protein
VGSWVVYLEEKVEVATFSHCYVSWRDSGKRRFVKSGMRRMKRASKLKRG